VAVAGGSIEGAPIDLYPIPKHAPSIPLATEHVARLLGEPVGELEIAKLLAPVGFEVSAFVNGRASVSVPAWRPDVTRNVDLIEEIARLRGYDSFSNELRPFRRGTVPDSPLATLTSRVREACVRAGLLEALSMPFVRGSDATHVRLANPMAEEESWLRRDLLETLARRAEHNLAQRHRDVRLFEIGSAFQPSPSGLPREEMRVAVVVMGLRHPPHWTEPTAPDVDEWDAKGIAELIARTIASGAAIEPRNEGTGNVLWEIAIAGEVRGAVKRLALDAPVWASAAFGIELTLAHISSEPVAPPGQSALQRSVSVAPESRFSFRPFPSTPSTFVDIALLVPNDLAASRVESTIRDASGELLESLTLLSEYRGAGITDGYRSIAWRLTFRHPERTLRDKEVAGRRDKVVRTLEGELGVRQRST
jgi:phenylalanyl-tRNA synthetase beta chain